MNFSGKTYLVTGGSGFLGISLIERILSLGGKVKTIARNEGNLIKLKEKFPSVEIITGNITSKEVVLHSLKGISGVFHLAAFKHIGLAEKFPLECINSNVVGTMNILECTLDMDLDFIIGISTDKVCQVAGVYGATKFLMERVFEDYERINPKIQYRLVRYGNVLYSTGSVLCKWKERLERGDEIIITDRNATRFYWTVDQAIDLIFNCLKDSNDTTPYIPEMKSIRLGDLMDVMIEKYLPKGKELKLKEIGLQKGENMHEKIEDDGKDSSEVENYTKEEIFEMV